MFQPALKDVTDYAASLCLWVGLYARQSDPALAFLSLTLINLPRFTRFQPNLFSLGATPTSPNPITLIREIHD